MASGRTPPSAVLFGVGLVVLVAAYVAIAFLYADGWFTILQGVATAAALLLGLALLYFVAVWWTRSGAPP